MFFYILIIPSLIILIVTIVEINKTDKHDKILYPFCQLRRNILFLLKRDGLKMSQQDYEVTNELLRYVDLTIHQFKFFKIEIFNIRKIRKIMKKSLEADSNKGVFFPSVNPGIRKLQEQYRYFLIKSMLAYTPFLRSEIILSLMIFVGKILIKMSLRRAQGFTASIEKYRNEYEWSKKPERQHSISLEY